jgi:hypothetical protein
MPNRIDDFSFQPFESRRGIDTVVGLRFRYDVQLVADLKDALRQARRLKGGHHLGGWLAQHRARFVERRAWPHVPQRLQALGNAFGEGAFEHEDDFEEDLGGEDLKGMELVVKRWFAQLALKYHPDRGGDTKAMQVVNDAHNLLLALLSEAGAARNCC